MVPVFAEGSLVSSTEPTCFNCQHFISFEQASMYMDNGDVWSYLFSSASSEKEERRYDVVSGTADSSDGSDSDISSLSKFMEEFYDYLNGVYRETC